MIFEVGLPPIAIICIAAFVFAILSDFLVELYSVRVSLATGRLQAWMFDHFGQNLFFDFLISILFQFVSLRKKAFFVQLCSLMNVGSFNRKQILIIILGSFIGIGLSISILMATFLPIGLILCALAFCLSLVSRDQIQDLGVGFLGVGLFYVAFFFADQYFSSSAVNIHAFHMPETGAILLVALSTLLFKSPVGFLIFISMIHFFLGIQMEWIICFFGIHSFLSLWRFYGNILEKRGRLKFAISLTLVVQILQVLFLLVVYQFISDQEIFSSQNKSLVDHFNFMLVFYIVYFAGTTVFMSPFGFILTMMPILDSSKEKKTESQKIIIHQGRGHSFSIHQSLFLLRQEFKKFTTSVHTIFKMSRESSHENEEVNLKFVRYHGMLQRVGDELKELCFSIGKQRSYKWQVAEIMSYYRYVNQLELLIDDLAFVTSLLRKEDLDENWEKECRYWLGLQLKIFESFFQYTLGVGKDDPEKIKVHIEKSYEVLDRFFVSKTTNSKEKNISQTFYRITESIANLSL